MVNEPTARMRVIVRGRVQDISVRWNECTGAWGMDGCSPAGRTPER